MPITKIENPDMFIGLELSIAQTQIISFGYECRLVWIDGRTIVPDYMMGSRVDYDPLRCNLSAKNGKVVRVVIA